MSLREMGYLASSFPRSWAADLASVRSSTCGLTEELARAWMSVASIIARGNGLGGGFTAAQRREYLHGWPANSLGAALSEPDAGPISPMSRARRRGTATAGCSTARARFDGADFISVLARTKQPSDPRRRHEGISQFLVLKERGKFPPGLTGSPIRNILRMENLGVALRQFQLPADALLGRGARIRARQGILRGRQRARGGAESYSARAKGARRARRRVAEARRSESHSASQQIGEFQAIADSTSRDGDRNRSGPPAYVLRCH